MNDKTGLTVTGATILGGIAGLTLSADERAFFRAADPWGFILFGRNVADPAQLYRLTAELRDAVGRDAPILIDQEGGRVQRMRAPHWTDWPSPRTLAAMGERAVWLGHRLMAQELHDAGIDVDCAPCLDVASGQTHPFLLDRCFGEDAEQVIRMGRAAANGLMAGGVLPVIKHLPGHGRAQVDSHLDLPVIDAPISDLNDSDFRPFRALADLPMAMTAHIRLTALDDAPATHSALAISLIREKLGFEGLLMTDDIGMQALSGSPYDRAAASIAAGCDIVLSCNETIAQMEQIVDAAGRLSAKGQPRADAALAMRTGPQDQDLPALRAKWASLSA